MKHPEWHVKVVMRGVPVSESRKILQKSRERCDAKVRGFLGRGSTFSRCWKMSGEMRVSKMVKSAVGKELGGGVGLHQFGQGRCATRDGGRYMEEWRKRCERGRS